MNFPNVILISVVISTALVTLLSEFDLYPKISIILMEMIFNRLQLKEDSVPLHRTCSISVRPPKGRSGNHLFMFASALGLALTHSCNLIIDPAFIQELSQSFILNLQRHPFIKYSSKVSQAHRRIHNHCAYLPHLFKPNTSRSIELIGYWQVQKYFVNHSTEIRHQLQFRPRIVDRVNTFLNSIRSAAVYRSHWVRVAVHIRRTDFLYNPVVSSEQYLISAMSYFRKKYRSVVFVIVSDDKNYCRRLFAERRDVFFTPDSFDDFHDMAVISQCDHAIITVGTYGWWGAFLLQNGNGEVVTDAKPDHNPLEKNCKGEDYFPPWFSFLNYTKKPRL